MRSVLLALLIMALVRAPAAAVTPPPASATPTPEPTCTEPAEPLHFVIQIEPAEPHVGDEVRVSVGISNASGLLFGQPLVALQGAAPLFGRDPQPFRPDGPYLEGPVTFIMQAEFGGTVELLVSVNYETECPCPPICFYRRTVVSPPFAVTVLGPTAVPTPVCTPPLCGDDEVYACPGTCPGGCGTICATRTPTPCPTPPCRNDEVFVCQDVGPGGCGSTCATRTPTPIPVSACPGDCNNDDRVDIGELLRGVRMALGAGDDAQCWLAFDRAGSGVLSVDDLIAAVNSALTGCETMPGRQACRRSGGVAALEGCCPGVGDFRNSCSLGTCGDCAFELRHAVTICGCGAGRCFDGASCVAGATLTPTPTLNPQIPTPTTTPDDSVLPCLQTGGTEALRSCCLGAGRYPNTCDVDTCACPLEVSHHVSVCDCGVGRCYDPRRGGCVDRNASIP